ncbi:MAG: ATP-binding cassette domain-containing protein, partial [Ktedonobacterales bacterium]
MPAHSPHDQPESPTTSAPRQDGAAERETASRRTLTLAPGESLTLGRAMECDVALDDPLVAPRQARLGRQNDGIYTLENLDQRRPIFVNGLAVRQTQLAPGAEAQLGQSSFVLTEAGFIQSDDLRSIQVDAVGLRATVGDGLFGRRRKVVLDDISLSIPPGAFVAIVGSSGAGKTTLLSALNGQRPTQSGVVLYNGRNLYHELAFFSKAQGYV